MSGRKLYFGKDVHNVVIPYLKKDTEGKAIALPKDADYEILLPKILTLPDQASCSHGDAERFVSYHWFRLWLADTLNKYKERLSEKGYRAPGLTFADRVCQPKLTISTQFQLLFDISAGSSILQAVPIILPISGLNIDASPDYTHSVQIAFTLRPNGDDANLRSAAFAALQSTNSPSKI
jgi:hypothetical protein